MEVERLKPKEVVLYRVGTRIVIKMVVSDSENIVATTDSGSLIRVVKAGEDEHGYPIWREEAHEVS